MADQQRRCYATLDYAAACILTVNRRLLPARNGHPTYLETEDLNVYFRLADIGNDGDPIMAPDSLSRER
ncbi:MAG: hypothetical protein VCC36_08460, partial [Gammaproteobacteria bacterium]